jgi:hypothetical protein
VLLVQISKSSGRDLKAALCFDAAVRRQAYGLLFNVQGCDFELLTFALGGSIETWGNVCGRRFLIEG